MLNKLKLRVVTILTGTALAIAPISMGQCDQALNTVLDKVLETAPTDTSYDDGWDDEFFDDESFGEPGEFDGPSSPGEQW